MKPVAGNNRIGEELRKFKYITISRLIQWRIRKQRIRPKRKRKTREAKAMHV